MKSEIKNEEKGGKRSIANSTKAFGINGRAVSHPNIALPTFFWQMDLL